MRKWELRKLVAKPPSSSRDSQRAAYWGNKTVVAMAGSQASTRGRGNKTNDGEISTSIIAKIHQRVVHKKENETLVVRQRVAKWEVK